MTLTPRALKQAVERMLPYPITSTYRNRQIKFLCDRIELLTPLADDWDWSTWDRLEPLPEPECECD